jgi:pimeloyl-ACP methyl ester carboxylesterase
MPDREVLRERARHALRPLPDGRWQLKYHRAAGSGPTTGIDLWEALPRMTCPTLLLWGAASAIVNQELADRMVAGLPNGREVRIERAGHGVHMDNPTDFLAALDVFLAEVEAE